jgi:cellulose synthase/poly-beta-1,6-N-acetylglucosamine synthase-like glycosyltransferase
MKQLRTILISRREARGAMYSHAYEDKLTNNEEFCLETESHVIPVQVSCIFISLFCHLLSLTCLTFHFIMFLILFGMIGLGYEAYDYVG